jgi:hypothetical protein
MSGRSLTDASQQDPAILRFFLGRLWAEPIDIRCSDCGHQISALIPNWEIQRFEDRTTHLAICRPNSQREERLRCRLNGLQRWCRSGELRTFYPMVGSARYCQQAGRNAAQTQNGAVAGEGLIRPPGDCKWSQAGHPARGLWPLAYQKSGGGAFPIFGPSISSRLSSEG